MFEQIIFAYEGSLRLLVFLMFIISLALLEVYLPRRSPIKNANDRRLTNLGLMLIDTVAIRLLIPLAAFEVANYAAANNIGLLNYLTVPAMLNILITIIVFDLVIYLQHVLFHKVKPLWRIHRVHHTDAELDVTTGIRFHPFEMLLSMCLKLALVLLLGPLAISIFLYELMLSVASLFTHSNIKLNIQLDRWLRKLIVTPDMHRVHHSVIKSETDSNYGNIFSLWDRIFKTYQTKPSQGYDNMTIGLSEFQNNQALSLIALLKLPINNQGGI